MIRSKHLALAKKMIITSLSKVKLGTVIDFPFGDSSTSVKKQEANKVIQLGADELDFVADYNAFKRQDILKFSTDIKECTALCLKEGKIIKWIIETGALSKEEVKKISKLITDIVIEHFSSKTAQVFLKTSTGYYGGFGATIKDVRLIKSVSRGLSIKA